MLLVALKKYLHPHYIHIVSRNISGSLWNMLNRAYAKWWHVSVGSKCRFYGKIFFRTEPETTIEIGDSCIFNSNHSSNLIGVYSPCMISTIRRGARIKIGNNCGFTGTVVAAALEIQIGQNVRCGANTLITDSDWHTDDPRTGKDAPVVIDDNVWLGYGVKVLKGVHIGKGTLIGAGSIVTKDIPAGVVAAGNPCKVVRIISDEK